MMVWQAQCSSIRGGADGLHTRGPTEWRKWLKAVMHLKDTFGNYCVPYDIRVAANDFESNALGLPATDFGPDGGTFEP